MKKDFKKPFDFKKEQKKYDEAHKMTFKIMREVFFDFMKTDWKAVLAVIFLLLIFLVVAFSVTSPWSM